MAEQRTARMAGEGARCEEHAGRALQEFAARERGLREKVGVVWAGVCVGG